MKTIDFMFICNITLTRHTFDRMSNIILPLKTIEDTMSRGKVFHGATL